jgi:predicted CoA-binding protein
VSRAGNKYGNRAFRELKGKGYRLYIIHPEAGTLEGEACFPSLSKLPEKPGGLVLVVPPAQSEKMIQEAAACGIKRVWMQPGAESDQAIRLAAEKGLSEVHGVCILMFSEPAGFFHRLHRWIATKIGATPR